MELTKEKITDLYELLEKDAISCEEFANTIAGFVAKEQKDTDAKKEVILDCVAKKYNLDTEKLVSNERTEQVCQARQVAMYLLRKLTNMSILQIAKVLCRKDHTTVLFGIERCEKKIQVDSSFTFQMRELENVIKNSVAFSIG